MTAEAATQKDKLILKAGLIGIFAALLTAVSDMILLGRPVSSHAFFMLGTESMAELNQWRITLGTFIGVFALPFQVLGVIPLYFGLKPAGGRIAGAVFCTAAYALIMGVAFHTSYAYIGSGWSMRYLMDSGNMEAAGLMSRFDLYWRIIIAVIAAGLLASSAGYVYLVMTGRTAFPRWMAAVNPVTVFLFLLPIILLLPAPAGGYIAPAYMNFAALAFFVLSLKIFCAKGPGRGNNK